MSTPSLLAFTNATAILPDRLLEDALVLCQSGRILHVGPSSRKLPPGAAIINANGGYISPGFIDIHVHGGAGADFMDGTLEAVQAVCGAHARHGTTTLYPTTTTGSPDEINAMLTACAEARRCWRAGHGARIAGVHLYGPFFAEDKVGCHDGKGRRSPRAEEYQRYFATGLIKIATCAAELPGAGGFYKTARKRRCLITCGHSNSTWGEMAAAFDLGMRHVDHFWCAMSSVPSVRSRLGFPMQGSMAEFVLAHPEMSSEVIADGTHLAPELLHFAWKMKTASRLCLVTDANRAMDQPPGRYRFGPARTGAWFESDDRAGWAPNGSLASSIMGMDHMVRHMKSVVKMPLPDVIRMASLTPAERAGISHQTGSLEEGKRADLLVLNRKLHVKRIYIDGQEYPGAA